LLDSRATSTRFPRAWADSYSPCSSTSLTAENGKPENLASAVNEVSERVSKIVREEIELAKAEVTQKATSLAKGLAAVAAGAVFGVFAVVFLLLTAAWGLNSLIGSVWLGFLIVLGALSLATVAAFLFA